MYVKYAVMLSSRAAAPWPRGQKTGLVRVVASSTSLEICRTAHYVLPR